MKKLLSIPVLALVLLASPVAQAQSAAARYEADRKLCAEESSSSLRMQCLRDARAEYDRAKSGYSYQENTRNAPATGLGQVPDSDHRRLEIFQHHRIVGQVFAYFVEHDYRRANFCQNSHVFGRLGVP